jgi:hypothetical protein
MPNSIPNEHWLPETNYDREKVCRLLYRDETNLFHFDSWDNKLGDNFLRKENKGNHTFIEKRMQGYWCMIASLAYQIFYPELYPPTGDLMVFSDLLHTMKNMRKAMEQLRMLGNTTLPLEDEVTMFHENMLMSCYGNLEICRAFYKLVEHLREKVINGKSKEMKALKAKLPKNYDTELLQETQICYQAIRDVADSYITLINRRGIAAIKAQVRWGDTGKKLESFLKDDDVEYYAKEYVTSALESWSGVLKVKLK